MDTRPSDPRVFVAGEYLSAGMFVTPRPDGRIYRAIQGDRGVGKMGVLDDCNPGDHVQFPTPDGGLGHRLTDKRSQP